MPTVVDLAARREEMVRRQIAGRGIHDPAVLEAFRSVPREAFLPDHLQEFAYEDAALPIEAGQTISQPFVVALMADALRLRPTDRVLEIGTGSGYGAAILSRLARQVFTVERRAGLAERARERLAELEYDNVRVRAGDGTLGWPEHAPYDAVAVTAGGPDVPGTLLEQLGIGGRLVIPVGASAREQELVRITRAGPDEYRREELGPVSFVALIGREGWDGEVSAELGVRPAPRRRAPRPAGASDLVRACAERFEAIEGADLGPLLDRIGDARVVLLGEATHGTSEFYRMRARITRELVTRRGFTIVAVEADWPDAAWIDRYVRHLPHAPGAATPFTRFPTWMWRNEEVRELVEWLRGHNAGVSDPGRRVGFYGLDLYSLHASIAEVLGYLQRVDPAAARVARARYGCLTPWEGDPATYGRAVITERHRACEEEAVAILTDLLAKRMQYAGADGDRFLDAVQNARLVANAERYYRIMYYGSRESWNHRDQHMFDTLEMLLQARPGARAVVWEHNSHVGDASATEMGVRGEHNVGQLCRARFGDDAYLVGFGTDHGTVAAAHDWDEPMEVMEVRPSHPRSYERVCHDAGVAAFLLALRHPRRDALRQELLAPRLERAIGVIYRPESELLSHYFEAVLPRQFDEYVWFDRTRAVAPLAAPATGEEPPETYPFGL